MCIRILFFLASFTLLFSSFAHAHSPYVMKQKIIDAPDHQKLIIEKLYGDGIIFSDPIMLQVRNANGAVVAASPASYHLAYFCPSISSCWVFPHGGLFPFAKGYKLEWEKLDYNKTLAERDIPSEDKLEFEKYLKDQKQERFNSYSLGYPELNQNEFHGFSTNILSYFISPLVIIADKITVYLLIIFAAYLQTKIFYKISDYQDSKTKKSFVGWLLLIAGYILMITISFIYFIILIGILFGAWLPLFYFLSAIALGVFLGKKKSRP